MIANCMLNLRVTATEGVFFNFGVRGMTEVFMSRTPLSDTMNRSTFAIGIGAVIIAAGVFQGCDRNPFKARVHVNRGSPLAAINSAIFKIRAYAEQYGHFPEANANLAELGEFSVLPEVAAILQYGGNDSLSLKSSERIIVLRCISPVSSTNGMPEFYCALLSGEILRLQQTHAILGQPCPPGIGTVMVPQPE